MRKKDPKPAQPLGVADGFDFEISEDESTSTNETVTSKPLIDLETTTHSTRDAEVDPNRAYSPYYVPKPKIGSRGGTLGRGAVDASERKVQFSLTCTPAQKARFKEAAKAEKRKLPEFICIAVEEYIEKHGL